MFPTERPDPLHRFLFPYFSHRIVRITEDQHGSLRVCNHPFQFFKVHPVTLTIISKRTFHHVSSVVDNRVEKNIIDRRQKDNLFRHRREFPHRCRDGWNHSGTEDQPFFFQMKVVALLPPFPDRVVPFFRNDCVAEYPVFCPFPNGFVDLRGRLKIHIRNPHR